MPSPWTLLVVALAQSPFPGPEPAREGVPSYPYQDVNQDPVDDPSAWGPGPARDLQDGLFPGAGSSGAIDYTSGLLPKSLFQGARPRSRGRLGGDQALQGLAAALTGKQSNPKAAEKNAKLVAAIAAYMPPEVLQRLRAGPLSREEARMIVERISMRSTAAASAFQFPIPDDVDLLTRGEAEERLDLLVGHFISQTLRQSPDEMPEALDTRLLRSWFASLDADGGSTISFLEFRDGTPLGLGVFQAADRNGDGLIDLEEFAPQIVAAVQRRGLSIQEELASAVANFVAEEELVTLEASERTGARSREVESAVEFILNRARAQLGMPTEERDFPVPPAPEAAADPESQLVTADPVSTEIGPEVVGPSAEEATADPTAAETPVGVPGEDLDPASRLAHEIYPVEPLPAFEEGWDSWTAAEHALETEDPQPPAEVDPTEPIPDPAPIEAGTTDPIPDPAPAPIEMDPPEPIPDPAPIEVDTTDPIPDPAPAPVEDEESPASETTDEGTADPPSPSSDEGSESPEHAGRC